MTDPFDPSGPSHLSASDRAVEPAVRPWLDIAGSRPCAEPAPEERQFGALGGMFSPTDQRAAVRQVRREPRRFVFSRFDLVTEDWEREGIMHVTAIDEVTGLCWTLGAPLWWDSPQYCPAYMSAYVVDELLAAVPSGTIVLTVAESNEVDYESVEFIATMLRQHLTEQEVAADQHWLNPEMEGQGASYAWPVAQLLGGVYQAWDESPHCVDELEKCLLARQGYEAVVRRAMAVSS